MNELSLFTGAGGGVLGSNLLGHRVVGYVENDDYRQRVIAQRIEDGIFDEAPIFGDIRAFNSSGYAESYSGLVDIVSGGFPCQDLSCAGKGAGLDGERSGLWFEMATTIRIIRPRYVFIENVPMLLVRGFGRVLSSLYQMGYNAAWGIVSAADVGAPHLRKRLWILAHANSDRGESWGSECERQQRGIASISASLSVAKSGCRRCCKSEKWKMEQQGRTKIERSSQTICYADKTDGETCRSDKMGIGKSERKKHTPSCGNWWSTERGLDRVAYGTPNRSNRLAAIGDGQVPTVAAFAFEYLRAVIERQ